ncbi:Adenosine monophosphate-protein transferase SoFic [Phycisphaerae bacterium RAS1]|nr:Adenosine monophosphate-protein transferase SoFic [Phycisphaerae bacterium RAS1]
MTPVQYHSGKFPPATLDLARLFPLIGPASAELARFAGTLSAIPNAEVLLSPLTTQEAVLSSKIEGTQATIGDVLEFEAGKEPISEKKEADILEVLNYRAAMRGAVEQMSKLPLSQRLVRDAHRRLMQGVRGQNKTPGDYRRTPNWIGPPNRPIEEARFIPPPADRVPDAMSAWERYLHADAPDRLVQLAILHAEFEAIHPFLDGNGRLGRLIVPLFLVDKKLLSGPTFYISAYFEAHRDEYYERLLAVSRDDDWTGWCLYFLTAVIEQARDNTAKAGAILNLYRQKGDWLAQTTGSRHAVRAIDWFFNRPIFKTSDFVDSADVPKRTAHRILTIAREKRLLRTLRAASGRRPAVLCFSELMNIAEGRRVF